MGQYLAAVANTGDGTSSIKRLATLFLAFLFITAVSSLATASGPIFAIEKNFCAGVPSPTSSVTSPGSENCALATQVAQGDPVYYVISITSPWGQPQQVVDLTDQYPASFVPTAGGLFCKDNQGNNVPWNPSTLPNGIAQVTLNMTQTIYCFIPGTYQNDPATSGNDTGNKKNTVQGKNADGYSATSEVKTEVLQTNPLGADLAVTKTSSGPINITSGSANITYTITIKNNGPADVDIADSFMLHDNLSLPPSSVPFNVAYVGSSCTATAGTDCLGGSPNLLNGNPVFVGTMAPKPFFDWGFAPGQGFIKAGGTITLTITVSISQLSGIDCVVALNSDGLRNTAFLTLIDKNTGVAFTDSNPPNNTASVTTPITTGQTLEDPDCGKAHLRIRKTQINPIPITNPVGWGTPVTYEIYIQNVSLPNQSITIQKKDLEDWVTEGINTPPFLRSHVVTKCVASSPGAVCAPFTPAINAAAPFSYSYYGHTNKAWDTNAPIKLPANGTWVRFNTTMIYDKPDCETVPDANPKLIHNTAKVKYKATAFGAPLGSSQNVVFNQEWTTQTSMKKQPPCNFRTTKVMHPNSPTKVQFGAPLQYIVRFTNFGNPRTVGTVMDVGRVSIPGYATSLPFASTWNCTKSAGVTGNGPLSGATSGSLNNTATPAMGAPVVLNLGQNIFFPTNGTITCDVKVTIKRPPFNDPFCTTDNAYFENMAMMDVTNPFNTNIFWPPAGNYVAGSMLNPVPQDRNWAMAKNMLPKCWDAHVQKSATVTGLPANTPAWTYAGNPNAVNFKITTTNDADSLFGTTTAPGNGWTVTDTLTSPYSNAGNLQGTPVCSLAGWCWTAPIPNDGKKQIGVKSLAAGASGLWNITNSGPWTNGVEINNCAKVKAVGDRAGGDWYDNRANDPARLESCVKVPVIETTKIEVRKQVIDQTGAGITAMGSFGFGVSCSPYAIPSAATTSFSLSTNSTGFSSYQTVNPVAKYGTCTISETSMPAIPAAMASKCFGAANVLVTSSAPVVLTNLAAVTNQVTVTNTYSCKPQQGMGQLEVIKSLTTPMLPVQWPATAWTINTNCIPAGSASSVTVNTPLSGNGVISGSGLVTAPIGATCTVDEPSASMPAFPTWLNNSNANSYCSTHGGGLPIWDTPTYTYNGQTTTTPPTVGITAGVQTVTVNNAWHCGTPPPGVITIIKDINGPINGLLNGATFNVGVSCAPSGTTNAVTLAYVPGNLWKGTVSVAAGDTCTFTETPPAVDPAMSNYCAGQNGQIAYWDPPTYFNGQTKTGNGSAQNFNFVNTWHCGPAQNGQVQIFKKVFGPTQQIPAMPFVINSNCATPSTPASVTINTMNTGGGGAVTAPVGTGCQFTEALPAFSTQQIAYCSGQNGAVPQWAPPSYSIAQPMTVTSSMQNLFVTNDWSCVPLITPGTIRVYKLVYGPSIPGMFVPQMTQQTYGFDSNCASPSTPTSVTITTVANGISSNPFVAPVGTTCSITETPPTVWPQAITDFCTNLTPSQLPKWEAPTFSIAQPMTSTTAVQTVTVTNRWKCSINGLKVKPKKKPRFKINIGIGIPGLGDGGRKDAPSQPRDVP